MASVHSPPKALWTAFILASAVWALNSINCSISDGFVREGALSGHAQAGVPLCPAGWWPYNPWWLPTVPPRARVDRSESLLTTGFSISQVEFCSNGSRECTDFYLFFCSLETHRLNQGDGKTAAAISNSNNRLQEQSHPQSPPCAVAFAELHGSVLNKTRAISWRNRPFPPP